MLGRHVYRVHSTEGRWTVTKEGEAQPRGGFAQADEPSRVTVDNGDGIILEERLFGSDLSEELGSPAR
jgi:hypothetical protein